MDSDAPDPEREHLRLLVGNILVSHTSFRSGRQRFRQVMRYKAAGGVDPRGILLIGESRTGKSRLLRAILDEWPRSKDAEGVTVPIVAVRVQARPSPKSLASLLLAALGAPDPHKGTEADLTERLVKLLKECKTFAIALDEFQHFMDRRSLKVLHEVADWLKVLAEDAKVLLIVAGLQRCVGVIRQNEQLLRRFGAPISLRRFDWFDDEDRDAWLSILEGFSEQLSKHFDILPLDSQDAGFRLWCATGGLVGYLAMLLEQAVADALDERRQEISLRHLAAARKVALFDEEANPPGFPSVLSATPVIVTEELVALVKKVGMEQLPPPIARTRAKKATTEEKKSKTGAKKSRSPEQVLA
jgi:hypothetical protein